MLQMRRFCGGGCAEVRGHGGTRACAWDECPCVASFGSWIRCEVWGRILGQGVGRGGCPACITGTPVVSGGFSRFPWQWRPGCRSQIGMKTLALKTCFCLSSCFHAPVTSRPSQNSPDVHPSRERVASIKVQRRSGSCP